MDGRPPPRDQWRDVTRATLDALYLQDCYAKDAQDAKNMTPDEVSFMLEAEELADQWLAKRFGEPTDDREGDDRP